MNARTPRMWARAAVAGLGAAFVVVLLAGGPPSVAAASPPAPAPGVTGVTRPPAEGAQSGASPDFACTLNLSTDAITGADASASAIGWAGNGEGVVTCLGGSFFVQDGINRSFGFGIYSGGPTSWVDADGYLPAQITTFRHRGATVAITEFADRVVIEGNPYVAVYCRVAVANTTRRAIEGDPDPSPGLIALDSAPRSVGPGDTVVNDYVMAVDRFEGTYAWPSSQALADSGGFAQHFAHMSAFWRDQLAQIAEVSLPDSQLDNAYRSGFIYTQIARSGTHLDTGVNGYQSEFSHDVIGILANLFTQGDDQDAHALLLEARDVVGSQGQYADGIWTYSWPWAIYLMKTGDLDFVKANFAASAPSGPAEPSIEATAHQIAAARTGPDGTIGPTDDIDSDGYWTVDDYEALMGLAAYRYIAQQVGDVGEAEWATAQYDSLLGAVNHVLTATINRFHLDYLPCSIVQPNTDNRCGNPEDANWAAPFLFGRWAWDAALFGSPVYGPGARLIDATYSYGFGRLRGTLPPDTFGGYPTDYFSTAYNAGYGEWGLAGTGYRDQGILGYQFMITHSQSGPYSWWESSSAPPTGSPWMGTHPAAGQGSSPHAWGMANANKVLLDSVAAQEASGALVVGRGVPDAWATPGQSISVSNFPTVRGGRLALTITYGDRAVSLSLRGSDPPGGVYFELPLFVRNIVATSSGKVDEKTGTVALPPGRTSVTVQLRH